MIQVPQRERTAPTSTKLTAEQRLALLGMAQHPGYRVLLQLMEVKCVMQDAALAAVDVADEKRVLGEHRVSVAMWDFFSSVQQQVLHECNELVAEREQQEVDPEERERVAILDAVRDNNI